MMGKKIKKFLIESIIVQKSIKIRWINWGSSKQIFQFIIP